jgi:hypothetical protein
LDHLLSGWNRPESDTPQLVDLRNGSPSGTATDAWQPPCRTSGACHDNSISAVAASGLVARRITQPFTHQLDVWGSPVTHARGKTLNAPASLEQRTIGTAS